MTNTRRRRNKAIRHIEYSEIHECGSKEIDHIPVEHTVDQIAQTAEKIRINTQRSNQEDGFFQKKYTASAASARPVTTMRNTRPHSASASM